MNLEKLKNIIPFLSLLVIFSSAVKLITYYKAFGIDIVDYMDLSEFTFSFLDDLYSYVALIGGFLVWSVIDDIIYAKHQVEESDLTRSKKRKIYRNFAGVFILTNVISLLASIWFINWIVFMITSYLIIVIYIFFTLRSEKIDNYSKYLLLIPTLLFFSFFKAKTELSIIKESSQSFVFVLNFEDEDKQIKSDKDNHYLGKTRNYTFFYNTKLKKSTIYTNSEILSTEIIKQKASVQQNL